MAFHCTGLTEALIVPDTTVQDFNWTLLDRARLLSRHLAWMIVLRLFTYAHFSVYLNKTHTTKNTVNIQQDIPQNPQVLLVFALCHCARWIWFGVCVCLQHKQNSSGDKQVFKWELFCLSPLLWPQNRHSCEQLLLSGCRPEICSSHQSKQCCPDDNIAAEHCCNERSSFSSRSEKI